MHAIRGRVAAALLAALPALAMAADEPFKVVATTGILADMARQVAGPRATVTVLVPPDVDPHSWSPSAAEARDLAGARLVVSNGLGLDAHLEKFIRSATPDAVMIEAAAGIDPIEPEHDHADHDHSHEGHDHGEADPHAWLDARLGMQYVAAIRDALAQVDAAHADEYESRAELYTATLRVVDAWTKRELAEIPAEARLIATDHDAFAYFARAYGMETATLRSASRSAEATGERVAEVRSLLAERRVPAIFCEDASSARMMESVARDAGVRFGGLLHVEALPPAPDDSYIGLFRTNVRILKENLK